MEKKRIVVQAESNIFSGYGYGQSVRDLLDSMSEREIVIVGSLPHGSGIDYDWQAYRNDDGTLVLANAYHGMDEYGGYVASVEFEIVVDASKPLDFELAIAEFDKDFEIPESWSFMYGLDEYLGDTIAYCIMDALEGK